MVRKYEVNGDGVCGVWLENMWCIVKMCVMYGEKVCGV